VHEMGTLCALTLGALVFNHSDITSAATPAGPYKFNVHHNLGKHHHFFYSDNENVFRDLQAYVMLLFMITHSKLLNGPCRCRNKHQVTYCTFHGNLRFIQQGA